MNHYRFPKTGTAKAVFAIFLLAMMFLARDTLTTSSILGFYRSQMMMLGLMALGAGVFLAVNRRSLKRIVTDGRMAVLAVSTGAMLLPMVVKADWQLMYLSILIGIYFAVFLSFFLTLKEVAKVYTLLLSGLGVYSILATYFLRILPDRGLLAVPVFENSSGVAFYNFGFSYVSIEYVKNRNFGIFREPGVYQFFLLTGLYLTQYRVRWNKSWQMWTVTLILAVTMVTTLATGGIIELALLALVVFVDKKLYRNRGLWAAILVLGAAAGAVIWISAREKNTLYWELYDMLIGKFVYGGDSVVERTEAVLVTGGMFLDAPLFGKPIAEVLHAVANNTVSTLILFAILGVCGGCLHLVSWTALVWNRDGKPWVNLAVLGIFLISFNTQNLTADVFFWLFPMMALTERITPWLEKKKGRN